MTRKFFCILLVTILLLEILAGCDKQQGREKRKSIKIGVTLYNQYDIFISELVSKFKKYASEKEQENDIAINIEIYNASDSQSIQNSQVENMIISGCDVICVNLVDRTEPTTIIDLAERNNIPIIFFNRELVKEDLERWDKIYYVGAQAFESGVLEGELVVDAFKNNAFLDKNHDGVCQYVVLEGEAGHQDSIVRTEYSVRTMLEGGLEIEKMGYAIANWNRAQAKTQMVQMFQRYGNDIELVLANNDDMALGAIDALKSANTPKEDWPAIVGIDGTDVGLDAVKNGEMIGTVYNDKEGQALAMLNLAYTISTNGNLSEVSLEDGKYKRLSYYKVTMDEVSTYKNRLKPSL